VVRSVPSAVSFSIDVDEDPLVDAVACDECMRAHGIVRGATVDWRADLETAASVAETRLQHRSRAR
jgi:hypothetical protein